ncbi:hypothetical protein [Sinorhizobium fredii]|uniref:hypothetical protein n=1 Tax=Rhizobium fredii TaxID=380 RepID=UPI0035151E64
MFARLARVVAQAYGQASRAKRPPASATPEGPGIFPPGSEAIASAVPSGTTFDNRLCPDENLLRQNASI